MKTLIAKLETSLNIPLVPAKSKKSDKHVVIRFGAGKPSLTVVNKVRF